MFPGIVFQIKRVLLEDGNHIYCMWLSRDPEDPGECGRSYANLTLATSFNSTMDQSNFSLGEVTVRYCFYLNDPVFGWEGLGKQCSP